jgi:predicted LPLAT superfamily acyltransferase
VSTTGWAKIAERGSIRALRLVLVLYRVFGPAFAGFIVHGIAVYYTLTFHGARRASRAYLRRVAARPEGRAALGRSPGALAVFLHIREFALVIFDRLVLWFGREGDFAFDVVGTKECQALLRPDRGAVVVGAHLGSFDALRALADLDDRIVNVLMYTRNAEAINSFFHELSPEVPVRVLQADAAGFDTLLRIRACIERGELVAILGDRLEPGHAERSCRVPLLGDPVDLPEAPYLMAGLIGCPLFFMVALRSGRARYRVFAEVLAERVELPRGERDKRIRELASAYAGRLEHYCLLAPYQWFNFYDYWHEQRR